MYFDALGKQMISRILYLTCFCNFEICKSQFNTVHVVHFFLSPESLRLPLF